MNFAKAAGWGALGALGAWLAWPRSTEAALPPSDRPPATTPPRGQLQVVSEHAPETFVSTGPPGTGSAFAATIQNLTGTAREQRILNAVLSGGIPPSISNYVAIQTSIPGHSGTFYVSPDFLGVGTAEDWIRMPMYPATAQRILDARGDVLPTKHMADLIHQQATQKIGFTAHQPSTGVARDSTEMYRRSNADALRKQTVPNGTLVAGHKKDIVVGRLVASNPSKVVIYGGWYDSGERIQPYQAPHSKNYVDYSHGVRAVKALMRVDGQQMAVADVLQNPALAGLLSDEGTVSVAGLRYAV